MTADQRLTLLRSLTEAAADTALVNPEVHLQTICKEFILLDAQITNDDELPTDWEPPA